MPLVLLLACGSILDPDPVERGSLVVCLDGSRDSSGNDVDIEHSGTVLSLGAASGDCAQEVEIEGDERAVRRVGWRLTDAEGNDVTPDFDVAVGDSVALSYRYRMVWGDVAGFVLLDGDGSLLAAADEGAWGDALDDGDVPGLAVTPGEVVATEATVCEPLEGHTLVFEGDDTVEIEPIASDSVTVGGAALTAHAVRATSWGEGAGCEVTDTTSVYAWAVSR
ncbi:MAG: hypothetical protein FJ090_19945 [Deltaproteobacteria bacterium]|nr:hypothetical protein [Deltaproteobacteria bacterium]